jgi:hypothetical protein
MICCVAPSHLARRLTALPAVAMREAVCVETLSSAAPADAVHAIADLLARRGPDELVALTALVGALGRLPYALRQELYEAAKAAALLDVARLFFDVMAEAQPAPEPEQFVPGAGRSLTLGERKAMARGGRREVVAALLRDPDATVIKNLLENPRLTERDVLAVAARRPVPADVLRALIASRWLARDPVRRALVMNPHTPVDLALRVVATLSAPDLRAVASDGHLADALRAQARVLLRRARAG